ncbi:MAG: LD-carboxypeptidase [Chitinophagaceae bacterium]
MSAKILYLNIFMNRKNFLSAIAAMAPAIPEFTRTSKEDNQSKQSIIPKYLKTGDIIGITCPAGYIMRNEIEAAVLQMESWGFKLRIGDTIGKRDSSFGGTDDERAEDFQQMLDDFSVKAIMCARGGYGAVRIIDKLNFSIFLHHPKWIIGFSDVTVLHSHLNRNYQVASIHSKMCNSFPDDHTTAEPVQIDTINSIRRALTGEHMKYAVTPHIMNKAGVGEGLLVGGNLKTLESLSGTRSDIKTAGKILFVEDTGEYLYSIDRMFWNLKRTAKLVNLKGLIVGGFKIKPDDAGEEFGRTLYDIVLEKVKEYQYPVCFDFPVGHQRNNYALKCGVMHKLVITPNSVILSG